MLISSQEHAQFIRNDLEVVRKELGDGLKVSILPLYLSETSLFIPSQQVNMKLDIQGNHPSGDPKCELTLR